jgi:hypothetical protein
MLARRRRRKKMLDTTLGFATTGVAMGVGAYVIGKADVTGVAAPAATGIGKMAAFMPITGTLTGAGMVIGELRAMQPKRRRRKKSR